MKHTLTMTRSAALLLLSILLTTPVVAEPAKTATLAKCQTLKDRTERYTALRRKGGNAIQMQQWKEQLRASEEQFRRLECKSLRRKLQ
jgi:hypothetical protein